MEKSKKIFISYPSSQRNYAKLVSDNLKFNKIDTWFDEENIRVSENIEKRLKDGVNKALCCIFLLNNESISSSWCMAEVGSFWGANKPIIIHPLDPKAEIPAYLKGIKYAKTIEDVIKICKSIKPPPPPPPPISLTLLKDIQQFEKCGLTRCFRIRADNDKREKRIKSIIQEEYNNNPPTFKLLASSGFSYLHHSGNGWNTLLSKAVEEKDAYLNVVLESPYSDFALTRALANNTHLNHWEEKMPIERLKELSDTNQYKNVSIKITDLSVNCSLFFTQKSVFYDPYLWALPRPKERTENNFVVMEFIKNSENSKCEKNACCKLHDCYEMFNRHFLFIEKDSKPLNIFLEEIEKSTKTEFQKKLKEYRKKYKI